MAGHRMADQAAQNVQAFQPTPVTRVPDGGVPPVSPGTPMPAQPAAHPAMQTTAPVTGAWPTADGSGAHVAMPNTGGQYAQRPASITQAMSEQQQNVHPQDIGNQINARRMEEILQASEQRTAELAAQMQAQSQQTNQFIQQTAEFQRHQSEIAQQQLAFQQQQQAAAAQQPAQDPNELYALSEAEAQQFGESLSVIDKRARLAAAQQAAELQNAQANDPRVAEMQQRLDELNAQVSQVTEARAAEFKNNVTNAMATQGLNPETLQSNPVWIAMMAETQQSIPGSTVGSTFGSVVQAALDGGTSADVSKLNAVFSEFAKRQSGGPNPLASGAAVPAGGNPRAPSADVMPAQQTDPQVVQAEMTALMNREASLRDAHRRGRNIDGTALTNDSFMTEMQAIDARRGELEQLLMR